MRLRYQSNRAILHTDARLLPAERRAWASWNYHRLEAERDEATLTYYLNRLQGIDSATPVLVTLNRDEAIDPGQGAGPHGVRPPGSGPGRGAGQGPPGSRSTAPGAPGSPAHTGAMASTRTACAVRWRRVGPWGWCGDRRGCRHHHGLLRVGETGRRGGGGAGNRPRDRRGPTGTRTACAAPCTRVYWSTRASARDRRTRSATGWPCRCSTWPRSTPSWACTRPGRRGRAAPVRFRREDFLGDPAVPARRGGAGPGGRAHRARPRGPGRPAGQPAHLGLAVQPHQPLLLCRLSPEPGGETGPIGSLVAEVENTPWHERHAYVVGPPGRHRFAKELHVSPFLPSHLDYELRYSAPGPRLTVALDVLQGDQRLFAAVLFLRRRALDRAALGRSSGSTRP